MMSYNPGMSPEEARVQELIGKIRELPLRSRAEVEKVIRELNASSMDQEAIDSIKRLAEPAFSRVWDNPADAAYDGV